MAQLKIRRIKINWKLCKIALPMKNSLDFTFPKINQIVNEHIIQKNWKTEPIYGEKDCKLRWRRMGI